MGRYSAISWDYITNVAAKAAGGDSGALAQLRTWNSKYGRAANQRARELEKRGMQTGAYVRAAEKMGISKKQLNEGARPRFSQAKTGDAEHLLRSLEETVKFLNYQTATVSGEMARREHVIEGLEKMGYNVGTDRKKFLDFLDSNAWDEFRDVFGSKDAMQKISDQMAKGADIGKLMEAYNNFVEREDESEDVLSVFDGWVNETDQG